MQQMPLTHRQKSRRSTLQCIMQVVGVTQSSAADGKEVAQNGAKTSNGGADAMDVDGQVRKD